jgi:hypothetical protein
LQDEIFLNLVGVVEAILECDESVDGLACEFVVDTDDGSLSDGVCGMELMNGD